MLRRKSINLLALALLATIIMLQFIVLVPWWAYATILLFWFLITLLGSFFIQWNYHLTSLNSNKSIIKNHVSLTFDDGPHPEFTPKVLKLLKQYNVKATFFLIGKNIEKNPDLVQTILQQGHSIGNHTYSHANNFGFFGTTKVISELQTTNTIIEKLSGYKMKLYRPAFGVTNPNIQKALERTKHDSIGWNIRSFDTTGNTAENILKRITSKVDKGDIVLLHDTSAKTVEVLERLLLFLQANNLKSVTVDELLNIEAYE